MEEQKVPQNREAEETRPAGAVQESPPAGESGSEAQNAPAGQGGLPDDGQQPAGESRQEVDVKELERRLAEQTALVQDYFQRLARMQADFENYRRRMNREREEWFKYASQPLVAELLSVLDNFERALAAREEDPARVVAGVEMIYRQLKEILTKEGLSPVPAVNEPFDPAKHEAIMQEETDAYPDNTVIEELRRGYYFKDRLLRPAMVKVARAVSVQEQQNEQNNHSKPENEKENKENNQTNSVC
ncbi:nucleotide exchange factor GrpE [Desulfofundulus thermosubterraneus]|uniref:Protein GrpE n=1 Tax=Desulfofundulus thermosubterraneus DSM 16057 TaxID=1121432 RepID=A0A1M6AB82_9FIRM|nr:nucleotide exchange factor GrpE [Desulfofundulus thermosubterraneus]SHI33721.1 molecular chaperone GrpE [Desulfofundulus thermosubterraneus DSM 16057]